MREKESSQRGSGRDRENKGVEERRIGPLVGCFFFLVCSYVGHFFLQLGEWGICKSDIIRHLARSDASEDVLSFLLIFVAPLHSQQNATIPGDLRSQNGAREGGRMNGRRMADQFFAGGGRGEKNEEYLNGNKSLHTHIHKHRQKGLQASKTQIP